MTEITAISEKEFLTWFPGKEHLWELLNTTPKSEGDLIRNYLPSKLWRLNNLYWIINKQNERVKFRMNRAQFFCHSFLSIHSRLIILKSRQQGISTYWLVTFADDAIFMPHMNCGLMAQDKDAASTLLDRTKYLWNNINPGITDFLGRRLTKDNTSELTFNNDSTIYIRTSFRSTTLHRLHISELGKIANKFPEKAKETKTGTLQALAAGNVGAIESTAEGANMFKDFWDDAVAHKQGNILAPKDFLPVFLPWIDDPDCISYVPETLDKSATNYFSLVEAKTGRKLLEEQKNFWIMQRRELKGDIYQEYPATPEEAFSAAKDGTYWAQLYIEHIVLKGKKRDNLYEQNLDTYCVMDLGRNDYTVLTFFQVYRNTVRIVHEYKNSGVGLKHYADKLHEFKAEFKWDIEEIALPHDGAVVELCEEGDRTRQDILYDYGVTNTIILEKQGKQVGIELIRELLPYIYIDNTCEYLMECFLRYTKKWNDNTNTWDDNPARSEYAHGADTLRYMAQYLHDHLSFDFSSNRDLSERPQNTTVVNGIAM